MHFCIDQVVDELGQNDNVADRIQTECIDPCAECKQKDSNAKCKWDPDSGDAKCSSKCKQRAVTVAPVECKINDFKSCNETNQM